MAASRLEGLTAVVTGSSSGIGQGIALALAAAGARFVICADLKEGHVAQSALGSGVKSSSHGAKMASRALVAAKDDDESVDTPTHELIHARHGKERAIFVRCDINREKSDTADGIFSIEDAIQEALSRTGRLDLSVVSFSSVLFISGYFF
jgi:NAD(P)-dependent dehydrogenase (short-subunit alcohol dehydrogenase family)